MTEYNGHRSWNAWNVALWIGGDEQLYNSALWCIKQANGNLDVAARKFRALRDKYTPDGAEWNQLSVKLALAGLVEG